MHSDLIMKGTSGRAVLCGVSAVTLKAARWFCLFSSPHLGRCVLPPHCALAEPHKAMVQGALALF